MSRNLPAQGARKGQKVVPGTGEIRLDAGKHKAAGRQPSVPASHDVDNQRPWETAKCRAEVRGGSSSDDDRDDRTRFERRPRARCAKRPATTVGLPNGLSTHSPLGAGQRTGSDARIASQRPWHGGMRTIDCLGESRVREYRTQGLGRGDWGGRTPGRDGTRIRRETDGTEPFRRTGYTEPAPYFTTPNRRLPGPLVQCSHGGGRLVPPGVHAEIGGSVDR